jgi:aryl-alcohol dehydrogenase-like predicted oxidoreductase
VVLATKAGISRRSGERVVDTSRRALLDGLDGSLRRLGVDHVDLWQVHAWGTAPWEETLGALDAAVASGRARYVGISNYNGWQTGTAAAWQRAWPGRAPLASTQVEWSLLRREVEAEIVPAARAHGLGVLAYSPLAGGVLTGKYARGAPAHSRGADPQWRDRIEAELTPSAGHILDALVQASEGLDTSPLTTALAWIRDQPEVSAALVGARTPAQLRMALAAESFELPIEIRRALDEVSAAQ